MKNFLRFYSSVCLGKKLSKEEILTTAQYLHFEFQQNCRFLFRWYQNLLREYVNLAFQYVTDIVTLGYIWIILFVFIFYSENEEEILTTVQYLHFEFQQTCRFLFIVFRYITDVWIIFISLLYSEKKLRYRYA